MLKNDWVELRGRDCAINEVRDIALGFKRTISDLDTAISWLWKIAPQFVKITYKWGSVKLFVWKDKIPHAHVKYRTEI